jgi:protein-L-isoaspartate(D-aspartate) O-methyltransferase
MIVFNCLLLLLLPGISATTSSSTNTCGKNNNSRSATAFQQPPPPPPEMPNAMRAWNCHGRNQREMVDRLMQAQIIKSQAVKEVMNEVDRQHYIPQNPYQDAPQGIGMGQTISAPHMHAHVLEEILPSVQSSKREVVKILDVGCGSGYLTATFGRWFKPADGHDSSRSILQRKGLVYGMDIQSNLVFLTQRNIQAGDSDLLKSGTVQLKVGNGWEGWSEAAPFDAIHVGAAAAEFPVELARQLTVNGILIVPVGPNGGTQYLYKVERVAESPEYSPLDYRVTRLLGVRYVPLVQGPNSLGASDDRA